MPDYKYTVDEVKENLLNLKKKLEDKDRKEIIWVIADRQDFRPLEIETIKNGVKKRKTVKHLKEIRKYLLNEKRKKYFIGKKFAGIKYTFDLDLIQKINNKNYSKYLDDVIYQIYIGINQVDDEGKIGEFTPQYMQYELKVVFKLEDLLNRKVSYRDGEKLMRIVYDRKIISAGLLGYYYKNLLKKIKEKKIDTNFK